MEKVHSPMIRLNANENFYGCSPGVVPAMKPLLKNVPVYPSPPTKLEEQLANRYGVLPENIITGAGSVRLIDGLIQTFVEPDEEIIFFERSFVAYEQLSAAHRRKYVVAPQHHFVCDLNSVLPLINHKTRLIFLSNPNNPTGTIISHGQLEQFLETLPANIIMVVDEAYAEYVTDSTYPDSLSLQKKYSNLVILHSFSKIYGLAGLRIGFAIADQKLSGPLKKYRIPYFLHYLAEAAALAALNDTDFISRCASRNKKEREFLYKHLKKAGYNTIASQTNFLYIWFDDENRKEALYKKSVEAGLLICNLNIFGQNHSLRLGIGNRKVSEALLKVFIDGY